MSSTDEVTKCSSFNDPYTGCKCSYESCFTRRSETIPWTNYKILKPEPPVISRQNQSKFLSESYSYHTYSSVDTVNVSDIASVDVVKASDILGYETFEKYENDSNDNFLIEQVKNLNTETNFINENNSDECTVPLIFDSIYTAVDKEQKSPLVKHQNFLFSIPTAIEENENEFEMQKKPPMFRPLPKRPIRICSAQTPPKQRISITKRASSAVNVKQNTLRPKIVNMEPLERFQNLTVPSIGPRTLQTLRYIKHLQKQDQPFSNIITNSAKNRKEEVPVAITPKEIKKNKCKGKFIYESKHKSKTKQVSRSNIVYTKETERNKANTSCTNDTFENKPLTTHRITTDNSDETEMNIVSQTVEKNKDLPAKDEYSQWSRKPRPKFSANKKKTKDSDVQDIKIVVKQKNKPLKESATLSEPQNIRATMVKVNTKVPLNVNALNNRMEKERLKEDTVKNASLPLVNKSKRKTYKKKRKEPITMVSLLKKTSIDSKDINFPENCQSFSNQDINAFTNNQVFSTVQPKCKVEDNDRLAMLTIDDIAVKLQACDINMSTAKIKRALQPPEDAVNPLSQLPKYFSSRLISKY